MSAGLGFKDFSTGEVLTAADVDGYLMQGIWVFTNAAARDAAVTSPQEGNACYLKDTDVIQVYTGSAWAAQSASNPISANIVDAKGDLIVGTAADTVSKLSVGANGTTLVADSAEATGLKWATPSSGSGLTYVGGATFSASSAVNLNNVFTSTYANYRIICDYTASNTSALNIRLRVSGSDNTTANYIYQQINAGSTSVNALRATSQTAWSIPDKDTSGNTVDATIFNPQTSIRTLMSEINVAYSGEFWASSAFGFLATTSFDGLTIYPASGTITGTVRIYGLANS